MMWRLLIFPIGWELPALAMKLGTENLDACMRGGMRTMQGALQSQPSLG